MKLLSLRYEKRPGPAKRLARAMDRLITKGQEWLESPRSDVAEIIACVILVAATAYVACHLFILLGKG